MPDENITSFNPIEILEGIAENCAAIAREHGIEFFVDLTDRAMHLSGGPVMFEQAILNIVNNAVHHGGPQLSQISLVAKDIGDTLVVSVTDDGKGIAESDFDRALGRFSQIGPSAGSGLGLPIAVAVAEGLGGKVGLSNEGGKFEVKLSCPL